MNYVYICLFKAGNYTSTPLYVFNNEEAAQKYCKRANNTAEKEGISTHYYYYKEPVCNKPY